jgi:hypothetical protein
MEPDWANAVWRKSVHSDSGACVEVAASAGWVGVRDTKDADSGPVLQFNQDEWTAFLAGVASGEFTLERLGRR